MSDLSGKLRRVNPWKDMDWPETCRAAADALEAQEDRIKALEAALERIVVMPRLMAKQRSGERSRRAAITSNALGSQGTP